MRKLYVLFLFISVCSFIYAQDADFYREGVPENQLTGRETLTTISWSDMAVSPHAVSRSCAAFITIAGVDYIYQFGGGAGAQYTNVAKLNIGTNTWTNNVSVIPASMSSASAVTLGDKIFLFGGESVGGLGKTYMYDPVANTWAAKAAIPTLVTDAVVLKYDDNFVYVIGGGTGLFGTGYFSTVYLYNVALNTYTLCTPYPVVMGMGGGGILGNTIIVAGGWNGTAAISSAYKGEIGSDMTTITWTALPAYPAGTITRMASGPIVLSNTYPTAAGVIFSGGALAGSTVTGNTYLYNICTSAWETLTPGLTGARSNMKGCSNGFTNFYVVAGYTGTAGIGTTSKALLSSIAGNCYSPIPVELTSFSASTSNGAVVLNWTTATETNNSGFDVERNSGSGFQAVGFVAGNGTTSEAQSYSFTDNVAPGTYTYRLKQIDHNGTANYSEEVLVDFAAPDFYSLAQNYPNPFNPSTKISFTLAAESKVSLKIFNLLGQEVALIVNGTMNAGSYNYSVDFSNLNSGVYFYQIEAQGSDGSSFKSIKKMILTK